MQEFESIYAFSDTWHFSSHKITAISDSITLVLHLFLPVFLPLKIIIPNVPCDTSFSSWPPHLQGFQTTLFPTLLMFIAFPQVSQFLYLFSVAVLLPCLLPSHAHLTQHLHSPHGCPSTGTRCLGL